VCTQRPARDPDLARRVCAADDAVDGLRDQIFWELLTFMMEDPRTIPRAIRLILISRFVERSQDARRSSREREAGSRSKGLREEAGREPRRPSALGYREADSAVTWKPFARLRRHRRRT
jgi:hypothetical protein